MMVHIDPLHALQKDLQILLGHLQNKRQELEFERAHRDTILESIDDALTVLDDRDSIRYINKRFSLMFDIDGNDWRGKHISNLYNFLVSNHYLKDMGGLSKVYYSVLGKQNLIADRCEIVWKKDQPKYINVYTGPVSHPEQIYLGRVWKFQDVSQEKELAQTRIEFLSLASHQLRTPLTAIWGYLKMIDGGDYGEIPEKLRQPLGRVLSSTDKMRDLINDLLDVSRLESGKIIPSYSQVELIAELKEELKLQESLLIAKQTDLTFLTADNSLEISTDIKLVREIFKNYLHNAIKYSPVGAEICVHISAVVQHMVRISVKDHGVGIPVDEQQHIFEKFYRAANVSSAEYEGTGLGLYFVRKAAQTLGGRVGFHSQPAAGSEFWVDIPVAKPDLFT